MSLVMFYLQSYNFEVLFAAKQKYIPIKDIVLMELPYSLNLILKQKYHNPQCHSWVHWLLES